MFPLLQIRILFLSTRVVCVRKGHVTCLTTIHTERGHWNEQSAALNELDNKKNHYSIFVIFHKSLQKCKYVFHRMTGDSILLQCSSVLSDNTVYVCLEWIPCFRTFSFLTVYFVMILWSGKMWRQKIIEISGTVILEVELSEYYRLHPCSGF